MPDVPPGQPDPAAAARRVERDLGPRVAAADDQDVAVLELLRVAIGGGMQLDDGGVESGGVVGHPRALPASDRDHDVVGQQTALARRHDESGPVARHAVHVHAEPHRQLEAGRVRLEVVRHRLLRRVRVPWSGEAHPGEPVVPRRREQAQRVPAAAPGVADPIAGVEDHERQATTRELVADGESGLASAHDNRLDVLFQGPHRCLLRLLGDDATAARRRCPSGVLPT